jgi:hypothetical protein
VVGYHAGYGYGRIYEEKLLILTFSLFDNFYTIAAASGYSLMDYTTSKSDDVGLSPGKVYDLPAHPEPQVSDRPLRCQNCGAPRKTSVCEYCGTVY